MQPHTDMAAGLRSSATIFRSEPLGFENVWRCGQACVASTGDRRLVRHSHVAWSTSHPEHRVLPVSRHIVAMTAPASAWRLPSPLARTGIRSAANVVCAAVQCERPGELHPQEASDRNCLAAAPQVKAISVSNRCNAHASK